MRGVVWSVELRREDAEQVALGGGQPARELMLRLFDEVAEQGAQLAEQRERLEKVERRLGQNSVNGRCRRRAIEVRVPSARCASARSASRAPSPGMRARLAS